jgi:hypothetical protein
MTATPTGIVKVMGGLLLWHMCLERQNPTITLTRKQLASEELIFLLGYLTTSGFQRIWQIKLDCSGKITGVSLM